MIRLDIRPVPFEGIYSASKAALKSLTEALYMECLPFGLAVVYVNAGGVRTNITNNMIARFAIPPTTLYAPYEEAIREEFNPQRMEPWAMPREEFAKAVAEKSLAKKPARELWVGAGLTSMRIFSWLPRGFVLRLLWNELAEKRKVSLDKSK